MDHEQTIKHLEETRRLIAGGWTQGTDARIGVFPVAANTEDATCYCLRGALKRATGQWVVCRTGAFRFVAMAIGIFGGDPIALEQAVRWNDAKGRTQADVIKAVDLALLLAREDARLASARKVAA